jgi:hypothetical protein
MKTTDKSFAIAFAAAIRTTFGDGVKQLRRVEPLKVAGNYVYRNKLYFEVYLHRRHIVRAVIEEFGPFGSHGWQIDSAACMRRGKDFARGVVQGFFDSEGSVDVRGSSLRFRASTVNKAGMRNMKHLLAALGYDATMGGPTRRGEYRIALGVAASVRYALEIGSRIGAKSKRMREALELRGVSNGASEKPERSPSRGRRQQGRSSRRDASRAKTA